MPRKKYKETANERRERIEGIKKEDTAACDEGRNTDGKWKKGYSGNPLGRQGNRKLTESLRQQLNAEDFVKLIIDRAFDNASKDSSQYAKLIYNYFDGMPQEYKPKEPDDVNRRDAIRFRIRRGLFGAQLELMDTPKRRRIGMAGRRAGKTYYIGRRISDVAAEYPDGEILYIGLTSKNAWEQMYTHVTGAMDAAGIEYKANATKNQIEFGNGGVIRFLGNDSKDEREKMRGYGRNRRLCILDECQSQKELKYLVTEIIEPTLFDTGAPLEMYGTPPRIRGTFWELEWGNANIDACRRSWSMFDNPFIANANEQLETVLKERGWSVNDPIVQREYYGRIVYDDEALVLKVKDSNYYDDAKLKAWVEQHGATVRATVGLDLGYEDADAVCVLLYSERDEKIWLVHEKTVRRQSIDDTVAMAHEALDIAAIYSQAKTYIMADMGGLGKKIGEDMYYKHKLPIMPAEKSSKEAAIENMQSDINASRMMIRKGGEFDTDAMKVVYGRDELDRLTRIVDDNVYHSDIIDSVLYAHRESAKHMKR